jgi:hypothetical protein
MNPAMTTPNFCSSGRADGGPVSFVRRWRRAAERPRYAKVLL